MKSDSQRLRPHFVPRGTKCCRPHQGGCTKLGSPQEIQAMCGVRTHCFCPIATGGDGTRVLADVPLSLRMKAGPAEPPAPCSSMCEMGLLGLFIDEQLGTRNPASD